MTGVHLPEQFRPITAALPLAFACHPGVPCFTECCRELDLALAPYDILRLKRHLQIPSDRFLDQYVLIEHGEQQVFPICFLTMVDDGRASCVYLRETGCSVYTDRPGSCRAYPIGRGAAKTETSLVAETLVLIREPHCQGFAGVPTSQPTAAYLIDQGMETYNRQNDLLLPLLHHSRIQNGQFRPTGHQRNQFLLALYDLDQFRRKMAAGHIALHRPLTSGHLRGLAGDDEELLLLGIHWLLQEFFNE